MRGKQRFAALFEQLGGLSAGGALSLDDQLGGFRSSRAPGQAVLISDLLQPDGYERALGALAAIGFDTTVVQVLAPEEVRPEAGGDVELVDLESGERVQVGLSPRASLKFLAKTGR